MHDALPDKKIFAFLTLFCLTFIVFGWFLFILALSGFFFFPLVLGGALLCGVTALFVGYKWLIIAPRDFRIALLIVVAYSALLGYFTEPTVFSGRDQGSIAEAAFRLAHNGELAFSTPASDRFFDIYGAGTALNFPGFAYTESGALITQFPLGYTSWLAGFVSLFGLVGPVVANAVLLSLFLLALYGLLRVFVQPYYAYAGLFIALTSFLPTWFAKSTLSENLAVFLFTSLVFYLVLFLRDGKFISYAGVFLSAGLLAFTRIEGFVFLALTGILMVFNQHARHIWRTYPWKSIVIPTGLFLFVFLRDFFINLPYYKMIGKAFLKFLDQLGSGSVTGDIASAGGHFTLGSVFFLYGLLILFILGLSGILLCIKHKHWLALVPTMIALPTFLYLFDPNISLDHPWMLRRYLFSLFPTLLFSTVIGIALIFARDTTSPINVPRGKRFVMISIIFLGLIALQYPAWSKGVTFAENRALLAETAAFSEEFSDRDLILVDRNATGDGFAMLTGPAQFLFGKNVAYFFNPYDLAKLNIASFEHTYLLVPEGDQGRYAAVFGERLVFKKTVTFLREQLEVLSLEDGSLLRFPEKVTRETRNLLFEIR